MIRQNQGLKFQIQHILGLIWPLSCLTQEGEGDQPVISVGAASWPG